MPDIPILMPQLGESIAEATVVSFLAQPGETVEADQDILEVETNKAVLTVASPCGGVIKEWTVAVSESYPVGGTLGTIATTVEEAERLGLQNPNNGSDSPETISTGPQGTTSPPPKVQPTIRGLPVPAHAQGAAYLSPRLKARMAELGLHAADLAGVAGSGASGRVTIDDFEKFIRSLDDKRITPASSMRVAVADAMRRSWTRPLATVGLACNLEAVLAHRKQHQAKPGPALYALRALALALAENSASAGRLVGDRIVHPDSIDVGFAVEAEDGVLVPVIRNADKATLSDLAQRYADLVDLARRRRLPPEATSGSIATVTNFGTFGLQWATPIPLPEQTLVLGLGAGRKVPLWDESKKTFIPVTEANLTLSFDHRVLDGGAAGRLVGRVAELLLNPSQL